MQSTGVCCRWQHPRQWLWHHMLYLFAQDHIQCLCALPLTYLCVTLHSLPGHLQVPVACLCSCQAVPCSTYLPAPLCMSLSLIQWPLFFILHLMLIIHLPTLWQAMHHTELVFPMAWVSTLLSINSASPLRWVDRSEVRNMLCRDVTMNCDYVSPQVRRQIKA